MPRPKKIAQEETKISEVVEFQEEFVIESEEELVIEPVSMRVPELETLPVEEETIKTIFKVYHLGNFVVDVEENSDNLNNYLELLGVDYKSIFHIASNRAFISLVNVFRIDNLNFTDNIMNPTEIQHFLGLLYSADHGTGDRASLRQ